jgi:hypothetical protein
MSLSCAVSSHSLPPTWPKTASSHSCNHPSNRYIMCCPVLRHAKHVMEKSACYCRWREKSPQSTIWSRAVWQQPHAAHGPRRRTRRNRASISMFMAETQEGRRSIGQLATIKRARVVTDFLQSVSRWWGRIRVPKKHSWTLMGAYNNALLSWMKFNAWYFELDLTLM